MKGRKAVFAGDIGCYNLWQRPAAGHGGQPALCMGADVTIAQGLAHVQTGVKHFVHLSATPPLFASALTGVVNAVYNGSDITLVCWTNATTRHDRPAEHPGTGKTLMGIARAEAQLPGF
jgi:indolepyruvate ferredoxin oxidoreductase alpha subunit